MRKWLVACLTVSVLLCSSFAVSKDDKSRSKPPSTSKSPSGSKPKFGNSKPPSSKPPAPTPQAKPKFGNPSGSQSQSHSQASQPKSRFGNNVVPQSSPSASSTAHSKAPSGVNSANLSAKARDAKMEESRKKYVEEKRATAPPKKEYVSANGKSTKIDANNVNNKRIRELSSSEITPERRSSRADKRIEVHHYHHDMGWYRSQPRIYVGGGYDPLMFAIMLDNWDANRRAAWAYNHRYEIEADAYARLVRDAEVQRQIALMEARRAPRDTAYVDVDYRDNPADQYDQGYVEAVYNPTVVPVADRPVVVVHDGGSGWAVLGWLLVFGVIGVGIYLFFFKRW